VRPDTRYAKSGDVNIAYQTFGSEPRELVVPLPFLSHLEHNWEYPPVARFLGLLGSLGRVTLYNQRGAGLSDPVPEVPTLEERMGDMIAVMDAVGAERTTVLAMSDCGPVAMLLAASHPERLDGLLLYATFARRRGSSALLAGDPNEIVAALTRVWGTGAIAAIGAPSLADDERHRAWACRLERLAASPGTIVRLAQTSIEADVRDMLPNIRVPTVVAHRRGDELVPIEQGREVAALIPSARFVELEGDDHSVYVNYHELIDEIAEFLTGSRPGVDPHRLFAAILFTDIVGSTEQIARLGDSRWRILLDAHDRAVHNELDRFDAQNVRSTGDGFLATFDGPVRAIHAAFATRAAADELGLRLRAGIHVGECELVGDGIGGMAVHVAARVVALAEPTEVLVTSAISKLTAGAALEFIDRGMHTLKGVPKRWRLFSVIDHTAAAPLA
jgi:pimeloyl-ACP methyl ester carboxylesterase/class 3 adenylate cyclase